VVEVKDSLQTATAVVVGILLLVAGVTTGMTPGGPPVQEASAQPVVCGDVLQSQGPLVVVNPKAFACSNNVDELEQADINETKKNIYTSAVNQREESDVLLSSFGNYINDTRTIALVEGKNAYIRALNNGSTKTEAEVAARDAIEDYYAVKQRNLLADWNLFAESIDYWRQVAMNTSDSLSKYINTDGNGHTTEGDDNAFHYMTDASVTLLNGSSAQMEAYYVTVGDNGYSSNYTVGISDGRIDKNSGYMTGFEVEPPTSDYDQETVLTWSNYAEKWSKIKTAEDHVQGEVASFIDATYDAYVAGELNNSDLIDPYLGAREYAPSGQFNAWALRSVAAMGYEPPSNLSSIGEMQVHVPSSGRTFTGILMSQEQPDGGFAVGSTYDAKNIGGTQLVVTANKTHEISGMFTLESAETADGKTIQEGDNITYKNVTYKTANISEYRKLSEEMENLTAQINARQQRLRNTGGGGGWLPNIGFGGGLGIGVSLPVVLVAGGAAVLLLNN
jgi:hypothetical protein